MITGYYSSEVGINDLGYKGNQPNFWDGVPDDIMKEHGFSYEKDWNYKTNAMYIQDFILKNNNNNECEFENYLFKYFESLKINQNVINFNFLRNYDFRSHRVHTNQNKFNQNETV